MITVTIAKEGSTTITGAPVLGLTSSMLAAPLRAATPATTSSAAVADVMVGGNVQTYTFVESYATVKAALTVDETQLAIGAKIPSGELVAGVRTISDANVTTSSVAIVQKVALGGTVADGLYKAVCTAGTVTITALQSDGTTTQTASTDTVVGYIVY